MYHTQFPTHCFVYTGSFYIIVIFNVRIGDFNNSLFSGQYLYPPRWSNLCFYFLPPLLLILLMVPVALGNAVSLQWRHNRRDGVSNRQPHHCLLNHLFRRRSKKTSKPRVTGLCTGNSPVTGEFPTQKASHAENVSIWWRHLVEYNILNTSVHNACVYALIPGWHTRQRFVRCLCKAISTYKILSHSVCHLVLCLYFLLFQIKIFQVQVQHRTLETLDEIMSDYNMCMKISKYLLEALIVRTH